MRTIEAQIEVDRRRSFTADGSLAEPGWPLALHEDVREARPRIADLSTAVGLSTWVFGVPSSVGGVAPAMRRREEASCIMHARVHSSVRLSSQAIISRFG